MILLASVAVELFFEFDSARLPEGSSDRLAEVADWAKENPTAKVVLDGNADAIGAADYNVGLSLRRAKSVQSQLERLGVDNEIIVVGYGEDAPRRETRALDRRVSVWTTEDPLYTIVDDAFGEATAVVWDKPRITAEIEGPRPTQVTFR